MQAISSGQTHKKNLLFFYSYSLFITILYIFSYWVQLKYKDLHNGVKTGNKKNLLQVVTDTLDWTVGGQHCFDIFGRCYSKTTAQLLLFKLTHLIINIAKLSAL